MGITDRQPTAAERAAYGAVWEVLRANPNPNVNENARVWRAVYAALDAYQQHEKEER